MSGGAYCEVTLPADPTSGPANIRYITRLSAAASILVAGYPSYVLEGATTIGELRARIGEFARQQAEDDLAAPKRGGGQTRTHYRVVISFDGIVATETAHALMAEFVAERFPLARVVGVVHQDTLHTHLHLNVLARQSDGKKLHLGPKQYRTIDEAWARIYDRHQPGAYKEHLAKKRHTDAWKWWHANIGPEWAGPPPPRSRRKLTPAERRERDRRNHGDEERVGGRERAATAAGRGTRGDRRPADARVERVPAVFVRAAGGEPDGARWYPAEGAGREAERDHREGARRRAAQIRVADRLVEAAGRVVERVAAECQRDDQVALGGASELCRGVVETVNAINAQTAVLNDLGEQMAALRERERQRELARAAELEPAPAPEPAPKPEIKRPPNEWLR